MWAAILGVFKALPALSQILSILERLIKATHNGISDWLLARRLKKSRKELKEAIVEAKKTKDTSKLEDMFNGS